MINMIDNNCLIKLGLFSTLLISILGNTVFALEDIRSSKEIQADINNTKNMMNIAHEMAENARKLGVDENDYIIWFAKQQWNEYNNKLFELKKEYDVSIVEDSKGEYLGEYKITFYCKGTCCNGKYNGTALGTNIVAGRTIAVDPKVIPLGSEVFIEGYGSFIAEDTGGKIKGEKIDIAVNSHSEAVLKGTATAKVYLQ